MENQDGAARDIETDEGLTRKNEGGGCMDYYLTGKENGQSPTH